MLLMGCFLSSRQGADDSFVSYITQSNDVLRNGLSFHELQIRPLSLTVRTEVSYSLMTSAKAVDILRYEFDSHRRQTSLLHFLLSIKLSEYVHAVAGVVSSFGPLTCFFSALFLSSTRSTSFLIVSGLSSVAAHVTVQVCTPH